MGRMATNGGGQIKPYFCLFYPAKWVMTHLHRNSTYNLIQFKIGRNIGKGIKFITCEQGLK